MGLYNQTSLSISGGFNEGRPVNEPGTPGPRWNTENQARMPRTWPVIYMVPAMGLGAMPLFQLGYTAPVFNNQYSPYPAGYQVIMPGITRTPFGG